MKKWIALLMALVMCLSLCACGGKGDAESKPVSASDERSAGIPDVSSAKELKSGNCGDNASFILYDNGVLVISGTGEISKDNPFSNYGEYLKYVRIEEGITKIGAHAFENLRITDVELPSTMKAILNYAFFTCGKLKSINFPEGLSNIGECAFCSTALESIDLPSSLTSISTDAFAHNQELKTLIIPGNVRDIYQGAFSNCDNLKTIILCDGVESIGSNVFGNFKGTRTIAIPNSVQGIGDNNIDYRYTVYCNDDSWAANWLTRHKDVTVDVVVGYDGFVKDYNLP